MAKKPNIITKYDKQRVQRPEATAWYAMQQRCYLESTRDYHRYGGRGIAVCDRWRFGEGAKGGFACFLEDMGFKPSQRHTLDRIDNDGNYEPGNCRWATPKEQAFNRSTNKIVEIDGVSKTVTEWAESYRIPRNIIFNRIRNGWDPVDAVLTPQIDTGPSIFLTICGVTKSASEWATESGLDKRTILTRKHKLCWPDEQILQPVGVRRRKAGYSLSEESRDKIRQARLGTKASIETREKMRLAHLGKPKRKKTKE